MDKAQVTLLQFVSPLLTESSSLGALESRRRAVPSEDLPSAVTRNIFSCDRMCSQHPVGQEPYGYPTLPDRGPQERMINCTCEVIEVLKVPRLVGSYLLPFSWVIQMVSYFNGITSGTVPVSPNSSSV